MANALTLVPPSLVGVPGFEQPFNLDFIACSPYAVFRRMDILQQQTTGSLTNPNPNGTLVAVQPTPILLSYLTQSASAGAAATKYYVFYTYTGAASTESLPSAEYILQVPAGQGFTLTIPSAGAPANATGFSTYVGVVPGGEFQQVSATALGSAATIPNPLTNYNGVIQAATNVATNVVGFAESDYDVAYAPRAGQPGPGYSNRELFGLDASTPPLGWLEQYQCSYYKVNANQQIFEASLVQAWSPTLIGTTAGILLSTAANCHAIDTSQSNKIVTIVGKVQGPDNPTYGSVGDYLDTGARILCKFNSGTIT
jgi:hypothetical protein